MKKLFYFIFLLIVSVTYFGCKKDFIGTVKYDQKLADTSYRVKEIVIKIPAGSNFKIAGTELWSYQYGSKVDANGNAKLAHIPGSISTVYLFDSKENLIMSGFVSDSTTEISAASTAKVLMYLANNLHFQPGWSKKTYINIADQIPDVQEWITEYEALFKQNPLVLSDGSYKNILKARLDKMTPSSQETGNNIGLSGGGPMMAGKVPDITVLGGSGQRSGLEVVDMGSGIVAVNNHYRRRAHAFMYKMDYTDAAGSKIVVKNNIDNGTEADNDFAVESATGATSVMGVLGEALENAMTEEDKVKETFIKETKAPVLLLNENESTANYKTRVVAPGMNLSGLITDAEKDKLYELQIETFVFDLLLPFIAIVTSNENAPKSFKTPEEREVQMAILRNVLNSMPDLNEEIKESNYAGAFRKLRDNFMKDFATFAQSKLGDAVLGFYFEDNLNIKFEVNYAKKLNKILEFLDRAMTLGDLGRMFHNIATSKDVESWDLLLKSGLVTLQFLPGYDSLLNTADEAKIKAEIKNMAETGDEHPYFEWSTTGKFGKIVDTKGHSGISFATADHIVTYQSTTNSFDLKDENNIDYIYVKASFNNVVIGMDTIAVNVKKVDYEMKPEDAVVTGKKHNDAANTATLYLQKTNGTRDIPNNSIYDFKIEWSTPGVYGSLQGVSTTYNDDDILYKATSEQEGIFNETVTARIYVKPKGENKEYSYYGQDKVTVKIDNDPKKKIYKRSLTFHHNDSSIPYKYCYTCPWESLWSCFGADIVKVDRDPEAKSYSVVFGEISPRVIGAPGGYYWTANGGGNPPVCDGYTEDGWGAVYSYTWFHSKDNSSHVPNSGRFGYAVITVVLK